MRHVMGWSDIFRRRDINEGVDRYAATRGAVLIDVRTPSEFAEGHIEGSKNIPLQSIHTAESAVADKNSPLFVYCLSGARSRSAVRALRNLGYSDVTDLGGIMHYNGKVVRQ